MELGDAQPFGSPKRTRQVAASVSVLSRLPLHPELLPRRSHPLEQEASPPGSCVAGPRIGPEQHAFFAVARPRPEQHAILAAARLRIEQDAFFAVAPSSLLHASGPSSTASSPSPPAQHHLQTSDLARGGSSTQSTNAALCRQEEPRLTAAVASSMSSWSPPESSGHELHQNHLEMAGQRADWDYNMTKVLLDLCIAEKEKFNYVGNKGPTKHGWRLVHQTFLAQTGWNLQKKQLQSKFHDLKRKYKLWKRLKAASGGGWDSRTGTITMDDDWWADRIKEDENAATFRKKPMQFEEELGVLFGTTDSEDSNLLCVGGIGDRTPSNGSDDNTPQSDDNMGRSGVGRACQRTGKEQVVDSPPSKRRKSVEYYVEKLSESMLERSRNESSARSREQDEIAELLSVVQADGVSKSDELYFIATDLFRNQSRRTAFRTFDLPEERIAWLRWTWDNVKKK